MTDIDNKKKLSAIRKLAEITNEGDFYKELEAAGYVFVGGEWIHRSEVLAGPAPGSQPRRPNGVRNDVVILVKSWDKELAEELSKLLQETLESDPRYAGYVLHSATTAMPNTHDSGYRLYINLDCPEMYED